MIYMQLNDKIPSYQLKESKVLLPSTQKLLKQGSKCRQKVVAVHDDMDKAVHLSGEECLGKRTAEQLSGCPSSGHVLNLHAPAAYHFTPIHQSTTMVLWW